MRCKQVFIQTPLGLADDRKLLKRAILTALARYHGQFDYPPLKRYGYLSTDTAADMRCILDGALKELQGGIYNE